MDSSLVFVWLILGVSAYVRYAPTPSIQKGTRSRRRSSSTHATSATIPTDTSGGFRAVIRNAESGLRNLAIGRLPMIPPPVNLNIPEEIVEDPPTLEDDQPPYVETRRTRFEHIGEHYQNTPAAQDTSRPHRSFSSHTPRTSRRPGSSSSQNPHTRRKPTSSHPQTTLWGINRVQQHGQGQPSRSKRQRKDATEAMPTNKPRLPYFDISNDPYFIKA